MRVLENKSYKERLRELGLFRLEKSQIGKIPTPALVMGIAVVLVCSLVPKFTAEGLLDQIATSLSGAEHAFKRAHWRDIAG